MESMADSAKDDVVSLRVDVSRDFRTRLRAAAARAEKTMGEFLEMIAEDSLREFEVKTLDGGKSPVGR